MLAALSGQGLVTLLGDTLTLYTEDDGIWVLHVLTTDVGDPVSGV